MSVNLDAMKEDTTTILADWGETLTIKRAPVTYGSGGQSIQDWDAEGSTIGTFTGEWQPLTGKMERDEVGRRIKSDAIAVCAIDENILAGDRIYRADGTFMTVNYRKLYEDHWTVFISKLKGDQ